MKDILIDKEKLIKAFELAEKYALKHGCTFLDWCINNPEWGDTICYIRNTHREVIFKGDVDEIIKKLEKMLDHNKMKNNE